MKTEADTAGLIFGRMGQDRYQEKCWLTESDRSIWEAGDVLALRMEHCAHEAHAAIGLGRRLIPTGAHPPC